jgi:hypothetical protein
MGGRPVLQGFEAYKPWKKIVILVEGLYRCENGPLFCPQFHIENDRLPRQAQGRHKEDFLNWRVCFAQHGGFDLPAAPDHRDQEEVQLLSLGGRGALNRRARSERQRGGRILGEKRISFAPFFTKKMIVLPRQARDKHRESAQKGDTPWLSQGCSPDDVDVMMGTFTKSFGSVGGYVASSQGLVDHMKAVSASSTQAAAMSPVRTHAHFVYIFHLIKKRSLLPRQARDKHRKRWQKQGVFP